jgi:hypothetical protein
MDKDIVDILKDWKHSKFIVVDYLIEYPNTIVLTDVVYWIDHLDDLNEWAEKHNCEVKGMTVSVPDENTKLPPVAPVIV